MLQLCHQVGPDGARLYSDSDVEAFMPYLVLTFASGLSLHEDVPQASALVGELAHRIGITNPSHAAAAFRVHFEDNPPHPGLVQEFERFFREELKNQLPNVSAQFANVVGSAPTQGALSTVGGERPAGTVPASPFARFTITAPKRTQEGS